MVIVRHTQRPFLLKPHKLLSMMALPLIASQREIHPSLSNLHQLYTNQRWRQPSKEIPSPFLFERREDSASL
ncbi:MAG TPA: hypothetical protein DD856_16810 [Sulfobacillus sp.]|nr:hypothetical protein [Sulfobacillus sp.]